MRVETLTSRAKLAVDVAKYARRSAVRQLQQSVLLRWRYGGRPVEQLLLVPHDLRTADPSFATEIYHGHFGLAGSIALTGSESPFFISPPSLAWQRELHGFGWLRHLRVAGDDISREHARALVQDWMIAYGRIGGLAWEPEIVARRIISWLSHATVVLEGAEPRYYEAVLTSLTRQIRYLRKTHSDVPNGAPRLITLSALLLAGLCAPDEPNAVENYINAFTDELEAQVLPDGGHVSRNPGILVDLLLDILPLRQCFIARDQLPPPALNAAIDRMMPMIRFFRLGEGSLAHFNGMGITQTDALANVLAYDDIQGRPVSEAAQSGYYRLHRGNTILVADMGPSAPSAHSQMAHAGTLSFELSSGQDPIIVNCGAPPRGKDEWQLVARSTAAHSTVTVCDTSSSDFVVTPLLGESAKAARLIGPPHVTSSIEHRDPSVIIEGSHDGYDDRFGILHKRRLLLTGEGDRVMGEDLIHTARGLSEAAQKTDGAFAVRFHLHPRVEVEIGQNEREAILTLPGGRERWRLATESLPLKLEDSVFLADAMGESRTKQIVIHGKFKGRGEVRVPWRLELQGASMTLPDTEIMPFAADAPSEPQAPEGDEQADAPDLEADTDTVSNADASEDTAGHEVPDPEPDRSGTPEAPEEPETPDK